MAVLSDPWPAHLAVQVIIKEVVDVNQLPIRHIEIQNRMRFSPTTTGGLFFRIVLAGQQKGRSAAQDVDPRNPVGRSANLIHTTADRWIDQSLMTRQVCPPRPRISSQVAWQGPCPSSPPSPWTLHGYECNTARGTAASYRL